MSESMSWDEWLAEAVSEDYLEGVSEALENGANPNARYNDLTALYRAAIGGRIEIARKLVEAGARVAAELEDDSTPLHWAAEHGDLAIVDLLLRADGSVALNQFDYVSRTPLICAVEIGREDIVRVLLKAGADVNANDEARIGDTALRIAAEKGSLEIVNLLMAAGADPYIPGWMWVTPMDIAKRRKRPPGPEMVQRMEAGRGKIDFKSGR